MKINIIYKLYHDGDFRIENPEEINCQKINLFQAVKLVVAVVLSMQRLKIYQ